MGENVETVSNFSFLVSKINVAADCSHEIKRHLLLGRRAMTNLDSIIKSRNIILLMQICVVRAMVFPIVMYRCESWTMYRCESWSTEELVLLNCGIGEGS